ncbi:nucleoside-diphosphate sugar epimerase [Anaeromicrobium sediminis]|uniref:Nucleoside-diphosphate sugar epimerase n=2 Tax=Anaeromicrobium sediminis TaxID=1478221 RepID=A0A267MKK0_9FIRM|nr:nucleoside-diphosphate sugar epimerase [Anaeromicrobium sediminis]
MILMVFDIICINLSIVIALALRFDFIIPSIYIQNYLNHIILTNIIVILCYYKMGLYCSIWRYASIEELGRVIISALIGTMSLFFVFGYYHTNMMTGFYIIFYLVNVLSIGGIRFTYRIGRRIKSKLYPKGLKRNNVLVIGAGKAGSIMIKEIKNNPDISKRAVAIIDDDKSKHNRKIHGVPVVGGRESIKETIRKMHIDEIVIAIPSASKQVIKEIFDICSSTKCKLKTLPGIYELINGEVNVQKIRDVRIEDLLGREQIEVDLKEICEYIEDEVILVTGGGGSIGSELCRQISKFKPKKLLILDIYENNAYDIQNELIRNNKDLDLEVIIASVRDRKRLENIFDEYRPKVVFHAAAHKHVPLMEHNPTEAIKNNVFGTRNVAELSDEYGVKRFVLISTDKAVNPTNIMGATKRLAEMIIQTLDKESDTEFVAVRFGNVLGSNGSVIPLFKRQIAEGGPITVTHKDVIRYFMTIPEAVQLVIQAGSMAKGGEIFVLDMGEPVKIVDLAENLIRLSGFEPYREVDISFTGLRPGEKLYEELLMEEEGLQATKHKKIFIGQPLNINRSYLDRELSVLSRILTMETTELVRPIMKKVVPTYKENTA